MAKRICIPNGHEAEVIDGQELEILKKYGCFRNGAVRVFPENALLPSRYLELAREYFSFEIRPGDVFVGGYLRTGTTWMQEITWNMTNNPNLKLNDKSKAEIFVKSPYLGNDCCGGFKEVFGGENIMDQLAMLYPEVVKIKAFRTMDLVKATPDRRVIKTHLIPSLLNPGLLKTAKFIYMIRNPKDVLVSNYHLYKSLRFISFKGSLPEFVEDFIHGRVYMGSYVNHLHQMWKYRKHKNILFLYYEDLKQNTIENLRKINDFIATNLDQEQIEGIKEASTFKKMAKQKTILNSQEGQSSSMFNKDVIEESGGFYRKGIIGSGENELGPDLNKKVEEYFKKALEGLPLPYSYLQGK